MENDKLQRFIDAQISTYKTALSELQQGRKRSHWMWFIFPQIKGLGFSETSKYYAIRDVQEAAAYLKHAILGSRLIECCEVMLELDGNNATNILGSPDDLKLKSSMTLFASLEETNPVFRLVLEKFFEGHEDAKTLQIIKAKP